MADPGPQLALAFPHTPRFLEAEFLPGTGNRLALEFLANTAGWPQGRLLIWGGSGTGKTHLLHIWARRHGGSVLRGAPLQHAWPQRPLAIDDIDQGASEVVLLHLLNAAQEAGQKVLLAASRAPARLQFELPDLASRLRATVAVEIGPPDDAFLAGLLARLAAERSVPIEPDVQAWVLQRLPRTPAAVQEAVARLDAAALSSRRKVTRALARAALADLLNGDPATSES